MKISKLRLIFFLSASVLLPGLLFPPWGVCAEEQPPPRENRLIVYYFHGNFRCVSCKRIEQYTRETVEGSFPDELRAGKIAFLPVNVEEERNQHFIKDYQLYTKSVVLSLVKDGQEVKSKTLGDVWLHLGDRQKFSEYVKGELTTLLKEQ